MDFAPYQDQSPETTRTFSPPPDGPRRSFSPTKRTTSPAAVLPSSPSIHPPRAATANPWAAASGYEGNFFTSASGFGGDDAGDLEGGSAGVSEFETSLPIRMDFEACLAYLLLPPAGGVLLLIMERKSDYVR